MRDTNLGDLPALLTTPDSIDDKYSNLKERARDFVLSLSPGDPVWENQYFPLLVLAVLQN